MRIESTLFIELPDVPAETLAVFRRAIQRRGWRALSRLTYRAVLEGRYDDLQIVQKSERDLRQAEYVSGIQGATAVCLIRECETGASP